MSNKKVFKEKQKTDVVITGDVTTETETVKNEPEESTAREMREKMVNNTAIRAEFQQLATKYHEVENSVRDLKLSLMQLAGKVNNI